MAPSVNHVSIFSSSTLRHLSGAAAVPVVRSCARHGVLLPAKYQYTTFAPPPVLSSASLFAIHHGSFCSSSSSCHLNSSSLCCCNPTVGSLMKANIQATLFSVETVGSGVYTYTIIQHLLQTLLSHVSTDQLFESLTVFHTHRELQHKKKPVSSGVEQYDVTHKVVVTEACQMEVGNNRKAHEAPESTEEIKAAKGAVEGTTVGLDGGGAIETLVTEVEEGREGEMVRGGDKRPREQLWVYLGNKKLDIYEFEVWFRDMAISAYKKEHSTCVLVLPSNFIRCLFGYLNDQQVGGGIGDTLNVLELVVTLARFCRGASEEKLAVIFKLFDVSGNALIDFEEMRTTLLCLYNATLGTHQREVLHQFGVDVSSPDELARITTEECFRTADTNCDGFTACEIVCQRIQSLTSRCR
eukprot:GHVQ01024963.1.p1 GENE.GHVQ01024963.1~~GHVQ01024963.1.p1  ORF type:complete len:411 (+),score=67.18 GHVQ01024963.1:610-1842(+)